jgi:hypothetical protein
MPNDTFEREVKIRMTKAMHTELDKLATRLKEQGHVSINNSDLIRIAIRQYLDSKDAKKARAKKIKDRSDEPV